MLSLKIKNKLKHLVMSQKVTILSKVHISMRPDKNKKCCSNCQHFGLWGISTGWCVKWNRDKMVYEGKYCKNFKRNE